MKEEQKLYIVGSFLLLCGVLCTTIIPVIFDIYIRNIVLTPVQYRVFSLGFIALGTILYTMSYRYYAKQLIWLLALFVYYVAFQQVFEVIKNLTMTF